MANINIDKIFYENVPFRTEQQIGSVVHSQAVKNARTPRSAAGGDRYPYGNHRNNLYVKILKFKGKVGDVGHPVEPRTEEEEWYILREGDFLYDVQRMTQEDKKNKRNKLSMEALNSVFKEKKLPGGPGPLTVTGEFAGIHNGPPKRGGKTRKARKTRKTRKARK
jgi:hypothetical protein